MVVVNSMGREMSVLQEEKPTEGKRLQLTIDYDVQRATEEAFNAVSMAGLTNAGAAVILDPRTGEVLAFTSRPTYDPNAFAAGIDRGTWASLNSDEQRPLNNRAIQGRYSPGSTFKMAVGAGRPRRGRHRSELPRALRRRGQLLRTLFQVLEEGRPRVGRPQDRDCAVVRRLLLHRRQHARRRSRSTSGPRCSGLASRAASICRTRSRVWCRRPSGSRRPGARSGTPAKRSR